MQRERARLPYLRTNYRLTMRYIIVTAIVTHTHLYEKNSLLCS